MYIVNDDIPLGCVYEGENGKTKYCPMLNHDDVPYCQYLEDNEAAIGIDERPVYCPIVELPYTNVGDTISRQAAIDALGEEPLVWNDESDWETASRNQWGMDVNAIKTLPPADAVEVVRCKDCKWHNGEINQCNAQVCASMCCEDFCSRAERRTDE